MDIELLSFGEMEFYDIDEFTKYLEFERIDNRTPLILNIIATISTFKDSTEFTQSLEKENFIIEKEHGNLFLISKLLNKEKIYYYTFFDNRNNVPLFITDAKKTEDIPNTLFNYINKTREISNLWISPKIMKEIKDDLSKKYNDMIITYFSAIRSLNTEVKSELRPNFERNLQYHGSDGKETLDEMEYYYGVLPKILEIHLPNGVGFKIDNKGIITIKKGRFGDIFQIIETVIDRLLSLRDEINKSKYSIKTVGSKNKFSHAVQKPWSIDLPVGMKNDNIPHFCKTIQGNEWNFTLLENVLINGSMLFTARIIDDHTGSIFDISTDGKRIDIYPVKQADIGTSMRFYEYIVENIDNTAKVG